MPLSLASRANCVHRSACERKRSASVIVYPLGPETDGHIVDDNSYNLLSFPIGLGLLLLLGDLLGRLWNRRGAGSALHFLG